MKQFSPNALTENSCFKGQFLRISLLLFFITNSCLQVNASDSTAVANKQVRGLWTNPTVTINQAAAQTDPTNFPPINFTVVFDQPVGGFTSGDVTVSGTAAGFLVALVTGGPTIYNVAVSGMTSCGTVTVNIPAGVCANALAEPNLASTSTDNTVTFAPVLPNPAVTINQAASQPDPTNASPINFTVVFDQPVTGFATGDVTLAGTAGATTGIVTGSGTTYNVAVSGMTASGTVIASIAAGVAQNGCSQPNNASTSTDNTVTINCVPPVVNPVANQIVCNNAATTAINFTGTATTFNWVNNTTSIGLAASGTGNIPSFTALNATATAITATLTVTPSNGACNGTPVSFTITVNPLPGIVVTRNTTCGGPCNSMTASGADVYTWTPFAGLYTDCSLTQPYVGSNSTTVYTAATNSNTFIVAGTNLATGCIKTASAIPNYVPPAPTIIPPSVSMCLGDPAAKLRVASGNGFTTFCSGVVSVPVPDNNPAGATSSINIAGIPASCPITGLAVTINMPHTRIGDMVFVLRAPNGQIINLDYYIGATGGSGPSTGFSGTTLSSVGTTPLVTGTSPYTGTFRADAINTPGPLGPTGPTGMLPTVANWGSLFSASPNGTWTLGFYDGVTGEVGTLTAWCLKIDYACPPPAAAPAVWSPLAGLFLDATSTIPYTANSIDSIWTRPTPAGVYTYQVTNFALPMPPVAFSNPAAINIPVGGTASPYSSDVSVYGLPTSGVTVKSVVLNTISHTRSEDIDIILQSPSGQNVILMSDAGGSNAVNATYTFTAVAPDLSSILLNPTGNYRPTNYGVPDNFPAPGPGNVSQQFPSLSLFTGNMNGTWKLFVMDDDGTANQGTISGGFTINFDLGAPSCPSAPTTVVVTVGQQITITQMPASQVVCVGAPASFTVGVSGSGPFTYQWQMSTNGNGNNYTNLVNGGAYSGVNTNTLTIANTTAGMDGSAYRVLISGIGTCASSFTPAAFLTVRPLPNISLTANPLIIGPTQTTTIISTVTPNLAATYTWYYNNSVLPGQVSSTLLVNYGNPGDYQLKVTDINGCTNVSNIITIANSFAFNSFASPNPSGGIFQVRYNSPANNVVQRSLVIYNNRGEKIISKTFTQTIPYQKIDVDVRANGKGLYWVELIDGYGRRLAMNRVVVQ
jgi:subtilisin-like proprotein convertase family protein